MRQGGEQGVDAAGTADARRVVVLGDGAAEPLGVVLAHGDEDLRGNSGIFRITKAALVAK